jgi:magnesium transporter
VVQSLASSGFVEERLLQRLTKVLMVALLNGLFLSVIVFAANWVLFGNRQLSLVVSIALFSVVVFASLIGTITPLILDRFGFNPAVASGPFITTINDLLGLTVYFLTISILL